MKALLLAAGRSKRMKPVKDKNFLNFLGKPLIQHQLEMLARNGCEEIVVVGGAHNLEAIKELGESLEMKLEYCEQEDLDLGMCGAVKSSIKLLSGAPVLILSSNDVVDDSAIQLVLQEAEAGGADNFILGKKVEEYFPGGYLETDSDGFISNIVEKPGEGNEPSDLVNLVVHYHSDPDKLVDYLEKVDSENDDIYEVALAAMMKDGTKFKAVAYDGDWLPIKFPWHVQQVFRHLFEKAEKGVSDGAQIADKAIINGEVIIEDGAKIFDGAVVNGPCYIGKNSVVATNALVRESNLGENCVIGFSTEVARSYLGNDVWTHSNYIGDSVIGNNVSFGAGTVTGNLRLDERNIVMRGEGQDYHTNSAKFGLVCGDNVRFGVNSSTMPGITIGSGSFIGAGIIIPTSIPEKSFVRGSIELKISENKEDLGKMNRMDFKDNLK
jgi:UDP-N-acetylglucosamine diphosphorylase / glucose-1-phosphate thymidylyltransferase / UDP-N-acetylgalactosamine diphosphorylase / glucosamine-1-phosphate N-acetyltransferase / galactosamine-1-phosphate N-acetyltransferase